MKKVFLLFIAATPFLLHPSAGHADDRSQCLQYGGNVVCWGPVIGRWKYDICEEGAATLPSSAKCRAQGGTWNGFDCVGLPPVELWRPTIEGDIVPLAKDEFKYANEPLCDGPNSTAFTWGVSIFSNFCSTAGRGPLFVQGYENHNNTNFFIISGKRLSGGVCSTTDTTLTYSANRDRLVECPLHGDQSFIFTTGATPALCSLGFRFPVNPRQECDSCKRVGNPIDPITGVKQQSDVDYAGSGPHPLRFERVYHSRIYVADGNHWRHNYSAHIEFHDFGTRPVAIAHRARGRVITFALTGAQFLPNVDIFDRLTQLTDGGGTLTGWEYYEASTEAAETYDSSGKLLSIGNRAGLAQTLEYSTATTPASIASEPGLLIRVTDAFGRQLNFTYDRIARVATMQDPAGQTYLYAYNANNLVTSATYPDGRKRTYHYGENNTAAHRLTGITDENNSRFASYFYENSGGMAIRSVHAGNADDVNVDYNVFGTWPTNIRVTDARGTIRTYGYQQLNGVHVNTSVTQPAASGAGTVSSTTTYNNNGNVVATRTDWNGNRTNYGYDFGRHLETSRTEGLTAAGATTPSARTIETQWHASFRLPTQITEKDSGGAVLRTTSMSYDPSGNMLTRTITAGTSSRTWTYTYNANGSLLTMDGPRTDVPDVTAYTYYPNDDPDLGKRGNVATITNAAGHVTNITAYNAHGQPLTIIDPNGLTTTLAYDARQWLTSRNVGGETTSYTYDGVGELIKVTLPDTSFLSYTYDAAHRLTQIADNLGNRIAYTLDAMGNRTREEVRDPANSLAQTRSRVFNNLNRLFQEIGAQNQTAQYAYDNQGNVTSITDPLKQVTANAYDALNRLIRVTDPSLGQTQYGYSGIDQLTRVTDPRNLTTSYNYDGLANLNSQQSPDTGATQNTYDSAGNLLRQTDAKGQSTSYAYDALNRVSSITFADGSKQNYAYDQGANGIGRLTGIAELSPSQQVMSQLAYAYDQKGRVLSETRTINGVAYVLAYSYDGAGRMNGLTYPSGRTVGYGFDALGRINLVSTTPANGSTQVVANNILYQPFGGVKGYTLGNGQTYLRGYDTDGRIASYTLATQTFAVGFDAASRVSFLSDVANPANTNTYSYDNLDRLTNAVAPGTPFAYRYDAVGNRLSKTVGSGTDTYAYAATSNRLSSITAPAGATRIISFDANGSTLNDGINQYAYDARGRLVQTVGMLGASTYQVNALGQRIRKTNATDDRIFLYDTRGRLIAETRPGGQLLREYLYLNDIPLAVIQ